MLRRFEFVVAPGSHFEVKQRLAMAPSGSKYLVKDRVDFFCDEKRVGAKEETKKEEAKPGGTSISGEGHKLLVLFGSNQGTSEDLALTLCEDARDLGFQVSPNARCIFLLSHREGMLDQELMQTMILTLNAILIHCK